jgi:hypothetical protein
MAVEAAQPFKISLPVSAALAQAAYNEDQAAGAPCQYTLVLVNANGDLDLVANNTDVPVGVLQNRPFVMSATTSQVRGTVGEVVVIGQTKLVAGGTITLAATTPGNALTFSVATSHIGTALQSGGFVTSASGKSVVGQALTAAVSGQIFKAVVQCTSPLPIGA